MTLELITVQQACKMLGIEKQALYLALKHKRIAASKVNGHWVIQRYAVEDYKDSRYKHTTRKINGKPVFDNAKGLYSLRQLAELIHVPYLKIYYQIACKKIPHNRQGASYVINCQDPNEFLKKYFPNLIVEVKYKGLQQELPWTRK